MALLEHWYPVTSDMGLVNADRASILQSQTFADVFAVEREITTSLHDGLEDLLPLSVEKKRALFVPTRNKWTAYFASGIQGSDPFQIVRWLSKDLGVLAMRVCSTPSTAQYPANIWEVFAPEGLGGTPPLGYRRSIAAANDGGYWVFSQFGEAFPFEDLGAYSARRKRDRFSRELFTAYLSEFGLEPFEESFYSVSESTPIVLATRIENWRGRGPPEFTLAEVREGVPWRS